MKHPLSYNSLSRSLSLRLRIVLILLCASLTLNAVMGTALASNYFRKKEHHLQADPSFIMRLSNAYTFFSNNSIAQLACALKDKTALGCNIKVCDLAVALLAREHHIDIERGMHKSYEELKPHSLNNLIPPLDPPLILYTNVGEADIAALQFFLAKEKHTTSCRHLHQQLQRHTPKAIIALLFESQNNEIAGTYSHISSAEKDDIIVQVRLMMALPDYQKFKNCYHLFYQENSHDEPLAQSVLEKNILTLWLSSSWDTFAPLLSIALPAHDSHKEASEQGTKEVFALLKQQLTTAPVEAFQILQTTKSYNEFIDLLPVAYLNILLEEAVANPEGTFLSSLSRQDKKNFLKDILSKPWPPKTQQLAQLLLIDLDEAEEIDNAMAASGSDQTKV